MARRLFTLLSVLSLLLFLGVVVLWVRSREVTDGVEFHRGGVQWRFASEAGHLRLDNEPQRRVEQVLIDREGKRWRGDLELARSDYLEPYLRWAEERRRPWRRRYDPAALMPGNRRAKGCADSRRWTEFTQP